jgi:hypothetical protein
MTEKKEKKSKRGAAVKVNSLTLIKFFFNDVGQTFIKFEHFLLLCHRLSETLALLTFRCGLLRAAQIIVGFKFLKLLIVRVRNETGGTSSFVKFFHRFCFQFFQRLLALTFDSSHMGPHLDIIFCSLLEGFSELAFIE